MRRTVLFLSILLLSSVFATALPVLAGSHGGGMGPGDGGPGQGQNRTHAPPSDNPSGEHRSAAMSQQMQARGHMQAWDRMPEQARERVLERAVAAGLFGGISLENGTVDGRFVNFGLDASTGEVTDHTVSWNDTDVSFLDRASPEPFEGSGQARTGGAMLMLAGGEVTLLAHDNPTGQLRYVAGNASLNVTFDLADGVNATLGEDNTTAKLSVDGQHAHLLVAGTGWISLDDATGMVTATAGANSTVALLVHPLQQHIQSRHIHERVEGFANGRLGAEASVVAVDGTPAVDAIENGVNVHARNMTHAANGTMGQAQARLDVDVESQNAEGRGVVLNVDAGTLNLTDGAQVTVLLDGEEVSGALVDDILGGNATQAAANVDQGQGAVQVTVYVPGFSTHTVTLMAAQSTTDDGSTDDGSTDGNGTTDGGDGGVDDGDGTDAQDGAPFPGLGALVLALLAVALLARRKP